MRDGTPLTDADRMPWLHNIAKVIDGWRARECGVLTCSPLKQSYRNIIIGDCPEVRPVYLKGHVTLSAGASPIGVPKGGVLVAG